MNNELLTSTFLKLRNRLWNTARHITGNDDDAADVLQEAFCRLWQHGRQPGTAGEAEGMTVTTVRNVSIDTVRQRAAHPRVPLQHHDVDTADSEPPSWQERERQYQRVNDIIDSQLTSVQRQVVRMRELEGRSFDDIASTLGMTPSAVRVQLSRARKIVRSCYRRKEDEQ